MISSPGWPDCSPGVPRDINSVKHLQPVFFFLKKTTTVVRRVAGRLSSGTVVPLISASLLSLLAVGVSVYLALFAGRSLLPGPLAGTVAPEAPRVSVQVPAPATTPASRPASTQGAPRSDAPSAVPLTAASSSFFLQTVTPSARARTAAPVPALEARHPEPAATEDKAAGRQKNHANASAESPDIASRPHESSKKAEAPAGSENGGTLIEGNGSTSLVPEVTREASRPAAGPSSTSACQNRAGGKNSRR